MAFETRPFSHCTTDRQVGSTSATLPPRARNGFIQVLRRLRHLGRRSEDSVQRSCEGVNKRRIHSVQVNVRPCEYRQVYKPQAHLALLPHL